ELRARRFAAGALDIEIPEAEVALDRDGELESITARPYDESHQMVEECMVAANEAVAKELWTRGIRILARLHEPPDPEKLLMLRAELKSIGVKAGNLGNQKVMAQFLASVKGHPLYPTIAMMVLRSMKRAVYDASTIGHFGLAKRYYAHFTSPIRRYPDLTLHRQLAAWLEKRDAKVPPKLLAKWAEHSSEREEIAAEAERGLLEIKKYRLLDAQLSTRQILDYDAVVTKCAPFGCFVEIPELAVSGLVHVSLLSRKFVRFNESDQTLSAPGGGSWRVGDRMRVHVARVDFDARRVDFVPVGRRDR
ncbi:MAG: RNB domain-containing ribonuclease, partial [Kiritimatiellae bacterium]|nr:RNB domain-containing ribonuclease [Kiritimatiellia bacterium]